MKKRILATVLTMVMCVGVLSGCGGKENELASGSSSTKTEKPADNGKKSGNTTPDEMDFSDVFYLDIGEQFGLSEFVGTKIPILNNAIIESESGDGYKYSQVNYKLIPKVDGRQVGRYELPVAAGHGSPGGSNIQDLLDGWEKHGKENYAGGASGRFHWCWYEDYNSGMISSEDVIDGYGYYWFKVKDVETGQYFEIKGLMVQKATNLFGEDCISKDGMEYLEQFKSLVESYNDK